MDGPKLRVIVEVSACAGTGLSRLVVPVFSTQTVAQLAAEVSRRRGLSSDVVPQLSLALLDGSLLFPDDQVGDVIRPDEPVYARINELSPSAVSSVTAPTPSHPPLEPRGKPKGNELPESYHALPDPAVKDKHVKVALITLELARNSGKEEPAKVLAFEGRAVSVKFSMDTIRREAARALGWLSEFRELALALLLISSLLRDVSNNFTAPEKSTVPFAESPVVTIRMLPSGTAFSVLRHLHWSARYVLNCSGFPARDACRRSMRMVREEEPKALNTALWVQNAGCKHIFHAHCYFSRTSSVQGCPAGCPTSLVSAGAIPFDTRSPHLVVVHSGSVVGKVQLPDGFIVADEAMINLSDQEIIDILSSKYHHLGPGLMVRMYDRKNTGLVSFRHSTVVSICCTSRHVEFDGIRRFSLNGPPPSPPELTHVVDLHHVSSPIFNESPFLTIEDLGLDSGVQDGEEIALYVIRKHRVELVEVKRVGKAAVYTTRADWHPAIRQTDRGMAAFLSALLVFTHYLSVSGKSTDEKNMQTRMLNHLLALTRFPPAVRSLYVLTMNGSLHPEEMRALSEAMYHLALDVVHPHVTKGDTTRVFEGTRILFSMLVERPKGPFTLPGQDLRASAV
ncbi:hypothetical protein AcW1_001947 [Taiwanofungus camphoratus]|nr:hypothetical protein AcW1_001947 [Antrodia cinnamomea]